MGRKTAWMVESKGSLSLFLSPPQQKAWQKIQVFTVLLKPANWGLCVSWWGDGLHSKEVFFYLVGWLILRIQQNNPDLGLFQQSTRVSFKANRKKEKERYIADPIGQGISSGRTQEEKHGIAKQFGDSRTECNLPDGLYDKLIESTLLYAFLLQCDSGRVQEWVL